MGTVHRLAAFLVLPCSLLATAGCSSTKVSTSPGVDAFEVSGDPTSTAGATWTYKGTVDGTKYDLTGVLFKPAGTGPFPAVILSHGSDGSAAFFASFIAPTMVQWGLV